MSDKAKVPDIMLEELRQSPERGLEMRLRHPAFALLIDDIIKLFDECGGTNFVEFAGQSEKRGKFSVCIQRLEGKTTAMMHAEARARIAELERERSGLLAAVLKAVADEPECPDSMPDGMWMAMAEHKDVAEEAVRIAVRHTKAGIHDRIVEAISPARAGKGDK